MNKLASVLAAGLFSFLLWTIYVANTGGSNALFEFVNRVPNGDKYGHLVLYGLLALLFNLALKCRYVNIIGVRIYWGTLIVAIFVFLEEMSQFYFPRRTVDIDDLLADAVGLTIASFTSYLTSKYFLWQKAKT